MAMPNLLLFCILVAGCGYLSTCGKVECTELAQHENCAVDWEDQNGDLNLLQADMKKVVGGRVMKIDTSPSMGKDFCRCRGNAGLAKKYNSIVGGENVLYPQSTGLSCQDVCAKLSLESEQDVAPKGVPDAPAKIVRADQASFGKKGCECVGVDIEGEVPLTVDNETVQYPAAVGTSCQAWDQGRYPGYCTKADPPDWCRSKWCYVDPCKCSLAVPPMKTVNAFRTTRDAFWSYATCGSADSFSAESPEACTAQLSQDACKSTRHCSWEKVTEQCRNTDLFQECKHEWRRLHDEKLLKLVQEKRSFNQKYGQSACRCIGIGNRTGYFNVSVAGHITQYPANLGWQCAAWDNMTHQDCKKDKPPDWCLQQWCYVDPCSCQLPDAQPRETVTTALFHGQPAYYSYATCKSEDKFSAHMESRPAFPPTFCTASLLAVESQAHIGAPLVGMALFARMLLGQT